MNKALLKVINEELEEGGRGVLCTVTEEQGSTPRSRGASMWVRPDGSINGTVGGGLLEHEAIQRALELMKNGGNCATWRKELTEAEGMACGGSAAVYMEELGREEELIIFGAGHVGAATAKLGAFAGFQVTVWDEREEFANAGNIPCAGTVVCPIDKIFESGISFSEKSYVVIVTRGHKLDAEAVAATDGQPGAYFGMIGSRSKIAALRKELSGRGVSEAHLNRIRQPIGLPLKAETPEEIAVSIIAEIIAVKRGANIEALREAR